MAMTMVMPPMLPTAALNSNHQNRRFSLDTMSDIRFVDGASSPSACTPVMITPAVPFAATSPFSFRPRQRCHSVVGTTRLQADPFCIGSLPSSPLNDNPMQVNRLIRRRNTLGSVIAKPVSVSVVAPGGGTGINASVYSALAKKDGFSVNILGQSRAPYDRYPAAWTNEGAPPPNLETFAMDLLDEGCLDNLDCLVLGSRGGQVVLPTLWRELGASVPPAIVMNGGCANTLPIPVNWPDSAVTFLLIGGNDYFKGPLPLNQYLADSQRRVPMGNATTAILLVNEMTHMPQQHLLTAILHLMIRAVTSWKDSAQVPLDDFHAILQQLRRGGWSGKLSYKTKPGSAWEMEEFPECF